jgi:predicted esterase YcpF (UPF0227 family)
MKFKTIYLLHGIGGSPKGSMSKIQSALELKYPEVVFVRPLLPCNDLKSPPEESVKFLENLNIPQKSLIIGKSLGGLVAAKLQEDSRTDLHILCFCAPTEKGNVKLTKKMANRVSYYSSNDDVISDRIANWPKFAENYEVSWMNHREFDDHLKDVVSLIVDYINR